MIATRIASAGIADFAGFKKLSPRQVNWFLRAIVRVRAEEDIRLANVLTATEPRVDKRTRDEILDTLSTLARGEKLKPKGVIITDLNAARDFVRNLPIA